MANFIHYYEYALGIDIDGLGKNYFDIKKHLSFNRDDKNKIDFNAICVNRILGDENSITGGNIRGLYWTYPDTDNHEEQRLERVNERAYTELCPEFKGTYFEEVYNILKDKFGEIGRVRILMKHQEVVYLGIETLATYSYSNYYNVGCKMVIEDEAFHMYANGSAYVTDNTKYHNFFNGSEIDRVHLVATMLRFYT